MGGQRQNYPWIFQSRVGGKFLQEINQITFHQNFSEEKKDCSFSALSREQFHEYRNRGQQCRTLKIDFSDVRGDITNDFCRDNRTIRVINSTSTLLDFCDIHLNASRLAQVAFNDTIDCGLDWDAADGYSFSESLVYRRACLNAKIEG